MTREAGRGIDDRYCRITSPPTKESIAPTLLPGARGGGVSYRLCGCCANLWRLRVSGHSAQRTAHSSSRQQPDISPATLTSVGGPGARSRHRDVGTTRRQARSCGQAVFWSNSNNNDKDLLPTQINRFGSSRFHIFLFIYSGLVDEYQSMNECFISNLLIGVCSWLFGGV